MSDLYNDRTAVLTYIITSESMTKFTTGALLNGMVHKDYITVHNACARVTREIITKFKGVSITEQGMLIPLNG